MKSWLITVISIILLYVLIVFVNKYSPSNNDDILERGPTCDTYYFDKDLRQCPRGCEFNFDYQICEPVTEYGCTVTAQYSSIKLAKQNI